MNKFCTIDRIPEDITVCLVLGARLRKERYLTPILELRLDIVRRIHDVRPDMKFVLSGCFSDTSVMYKYLVENLGLPEDIFLIHHKGFNTYHSVFDMVNRYNERRFLVLTSTFHIVRSMAIARWLHADAVALDISGFEKAKSNPYAVREKLAMLKAACLAFFEVSGIHHLVCMSVFPFIERMYRLWMRLLISRGGGKDKEFVEGILKQARNDMDGRNPVLYFADKMMGFKDTQNILKYVSPESLVVKPRHPDCTSFIEYALAYSFAYLDGKSDFANFCEYVRLIRYKDGIINDYTSRNHYFSWLADNLVRMGLAREIDGRDVAGSDNAYSEPFVGKQVIRLSFMSDHYHSYPQMKNNSYFREVIRSLEQSWDGREFPFIPRELTNQPKDSPLGVIQDGDILMIVVDQHSWAKGLDIKHLLIAKWIDDRLCFIHTDDISARVQYSRTDLYSYLKDKFTMAGIRVLRPLLVEIKDDNRP